jgi:thioredoxin 1
MKPQRWIIVAALLAILGVVIARQSLKGRSPEHRTADAQAPRSSAITAQQPTPDSPEGPLPGSKLRECLQSGRPTMADFGKGWCVPCKRMVPVLKQAARDYRGKANIVYVDLEKHADLGRRYRIATMPTQVFFDASGTEVSRHMGYMDPKEIERRLAALKASK